ncbi:hypothetical protein BDB00DRAFT_770854 [Zychaea mexicana]|uniref:uncharacterized protein n=1 Tax=Zychaea mexicana TaxID=64656 RepID=UPI0022FE5835|nr:uncharacterized protein BDB00DRAFT_770854 [Zychaea mexicana]KAI9489285.1 hypothetical protein BDB00DRAFT_770854 [Zychaea mexicana]
MIFRKLQRKTVAVDLDQTLAHTLEAMVLWHNQVYNTSYTLADFNTYDFHKVWGGSVQDTHAKVREFYESSHFEQIQPIHDFALEALKMLKKRKFTLVIITSRQQFIAEETKKFVDKHYPGIFESIYFCNLGLSDAEQLEYVSKPKSAICQEIGVDVLIDDNLDHAVDCAGLEDIEVLLYDRKGQYRWNHTSISSSGSKGISSWKEIIAFFPKPHSPLRNCYYPQDLASAGAYRDNDDDDDGDEDEHYGYEHHHDIEYETIEVEHMDMSDEEETVWV